MHNGVVNFNLTNDNGENVIMDTRLKNIFAYESDLVNELLNSNNRELNISDIYAKMEYYKLTGEFEEINKIYKEYDFDIYTIESKKAVYNCFSILKDILSENVDEVILDFASGNSIMGEYLNKRIRFSDYILNDMSVHNLQASKNRIICKDKECLINYIAFDLCNIPFKEKSIDYSISFVGFQNMINFECVVKELIRITRKRIYHISTFCNKDDKVNMMSLRMANMQNSWNKSTFLDVLDRNGLGYNELYSVVAEVEPLKSGDIVKGYKVDKFPVVKTKIEYSMGEIIIL